MVEIYNVRFQIQFEGGYKNDSWRLCGDVYNHPTFRDGHNVMPSVPVSFNEETLVFTTSSGREYKIKSFYTPEKKEEIIEEIRNILKNKTFSRH